MRSFVIGILALALVTIFGVTSTAEEGGNGNGTAGHASKEGLSGSTGKMPSSFFETLRVKGNSCYVYLEPNEQAAYFGPLVKEERVKKLDALRGYVRVWIPRLRISGWVLHADVQATHKSDATEEIMPAKLMTAVRVRTKMANVRERPTSRSSVIFVAEKGREFWLLNEKKGWYQIWIPRLERKGWIYGRIVERQSRDENGP